jgi:hypothetical protein
VTPAEADYLLAEWARWQAGDAVYIGYPRSTPFGRLIKPDPMPLKVPIDEARALRTDRAIARLTGRRRFLLKLHYLDRAPIDAKARRLKVGRTEYKARINGICAIVGLLLDPPKESLAIRTRNVVFSGQAGLVSEDAAQL